MMRRMSKRLAARALVASSTSSSPVEEVTGARKGWSSTSGMTFLLSEDHVEGDDQHERSGAEQGGRAVPLLVADDRVGFLRFALEPPHEAAELALWLGLCKHRDAHEHDCVGGEGGDGLPPGHGQLRLDRDHLA